MTDSRSTLFSCRDLGVSVANRCLVNALTLTVDRSEFVAILGQNGSGKSLSLHTMAGLRTPAAGSVFVKGLDVVRERRQTLARHLAMLPQHVDDIFPATVLDTALIGRHPHIGRFNWESAADIDSAKSALTAVGLQDLYERDVLTLSGGERRRLAIAQILTQQPDVYLLDEPTNHLDPQHQLDALALFRSQADDGAVVLASLHDVNLAARFADRCLLLYGNGQWDLGRTEDILTEENLSRLYDTTMEAIDWRAGRLFVATTA